MKVTSSKTLIIVCVPVKVVVGMRQKQHLTLRLCVKTSAWCTKHVKPYSNPTLDSTPVKVAYYGSVPLTP